MFIDALSIYEAILHRSCKRREMKLLKGICRERVLSASTLDDLLTLIKFQETNIEVVKRFVGFLLDVANYG